MAEAGPASLLQKNVDHFDQEAQNWEEKTYVKEWISKATAAYDQAGVELGPNTVFLDFGCGTDIMSELLVPKVQQAIGVDTSPKMVAAYNAKATAKGISNMAAVCLDVTDEAAVAAAQASGALPVSVDAASVHMTLHHVEDVQKVLNSLCRLLRPGSGRLLITDLFKEEHSNHFHGMQFVHHTVAHKGGFSEAQLRELMAGAGCEVEHFNSKAVPITMEVAQEDGSKKQVQFDIFLLVAKKQD